MLFSDYLTTTDTRHDAMAERLGVTREYISMLAAGKRAPSRELAVKIERETAGTVPVESWTTQAAE